MRSNCRTCTFRHKGLESCHFWIKSLLSGSELRYCFRHLKCGIMIDKAHRVKPTSHTSIKGDRVALGSSGPFGVIMRSVMKGRVTDSPLEIDELGVEEVFSCKVNILPKSLTAVKILNCD